MNLISVVLFGTGGVLVYSAIKGFDPRDVVKYALGGPQPVSFRDLEDADFRPDSYGGANPYLGKDGKPRYDPDGGASDDSGSGPAFNPTTDPIPPSASV